MDSGDFSRMAPEVSWTRLLTPEAGVYSMGLVLRDVLGDISEMQKGKSCSMMLHVFRWCGNTLLSAYVENVIQLAFWSKTTN